MPFIDVRTSKTLSPERKEHIKCELGKAVALLGKTERYLMVQISDGCTLWFAGEHMTDGAYVAVSLFGRAPSAAYVQMTERLCSILKEEGIAPERTYVTYHPVADWGWNGENF